MEIDPRTRLFFHCNPIVMWILVLLGIILIMIMGYVIIDGYFRLQKNKRIKNHRKLEFLDYQMILSTPRKYKFHSPYGIESALIAFNSETPYILDVIDTCIQRNRHLISRYENNEDPEILATYLDIEIKLTTMIATSGINLMNRCKFYCQNLSTTFQLLCDSELVRQYIDNAEKLHKQFHTLETEKFKTPEVMKISRTMYNEFFDFFEMINSAVSIYEDKDYKEETNNDEC